MTDISDSLSAYDHTDLEIDENIREFLKHEIEMTEYEGKERAGLITYKENKLKNIVPFDHLREQGYLEDRGEKSIKFNDQFETEVRRLNQDGMKVVGYHTHPKDIPESGFLDRNILNQRRCLDIVAVDDQGIETGKIVGTYDHEKTSKRELKTEGKEAIEEFTAQISVHYFYL